MTAHDEAGQDVAAVAKQLSQVLDIAGKYQVPGSCITEAELTRALGTATPDQQREISRIVTGFGPLTTAAIQAKSQADFRQRTLDILWSHIGCCRKCARAVLRDTRMCRHGRVLSALANIDPVELTTRV